MTKFKVQNKSKTRNTNVKTKVLTFVICAYFEF